MHRMFPAGSAAQARWWQASQRNRRMAARVFSILFSIAVVAQLILLTQPARSDAHATGLFFVPLVTALTALGEFWFARRVRPDSDPDDPLPRRLTWGLATLEVTGPMFAVFLIGQIVDWSTAFGSPPVLALLLIMGVSTLRLDYRICLYQGALAASQLALLLHSALDAAQGDRRLTTLGLEFHLGQVLVMFIGGALCAFVAHQSRLRLSEVIRSRVAEEQYQAALWQKNELISILSHDLRTPLDGVAGLAELMARTPDRFTAKEIAGYARNIHDTARNLRELLDNLVAWAELRSGSEPRPPEPLNLAATVRPTLRLFEPALTSKSITVHRTWDEELAGLSDGLTLATVVRNLLSNAVKATPAGGTITLRTDATARPGEVALVIADTGPGLPPDFQLASCHNSVDTPRRHGLGLMLCQQLLTRSAGRLELRSPAAGGTEAWVWLPRPPRT